MTTPSSTLPERYTGPVGLTEKVTPSTRRAWNERAVSLLSAPAETLTPDERAELARYSGWGGTGVGASTSEYYTPPALSEAITALVRPLLPARPTVLEPSCGTGTFLSHLRGDVTAVELSPESAAIAQRLFPDVTVHQQSFEQYWLNNRHRRFDLVIGNPPYGPRPTNGYDLPGDIEAARYFLRRALDLTVSGGIVALLMPYGLARSRGDTHRRERILAHADVLGIYGLPTDTFGISHTTLATTDLWILRKHSELTACALEVGGDALREYAGLDSDLSSAFLQGSVHELHPEWLLGEETERSGVAGRPAYARNGTLDDAVQGLRRQRITAAAPVSETGILAHLTQLDEQLVVRARALHRRGRHGGNPGDTRVEGSKFQVFFHKWHTVTPDLPPALDAFRRLGSTARLHAELIGFRDLGAANNLQAQLAPLMRQAALRHASALTAPATARVAQVDADIAAFINAFSAEGELTSRLAAPTQRRDETVDPNSTRSVASYLSDRGLLTEQDVAQVMDIAPAEAALRLLDAGYARTAHQWIPQELFFVGRSEEIRRAVLAVQRLGLPHLDPIVQRQQAMLDERLQPRRLADFETTPHSGFMPEDIVRQWIRTYLTERHVDPRECRVDRDRNNWTVTISQWADRSGIKRLNFFKRYLTRHGRRKDEAEEYAEVDAHFRSFVEDHHRDEVEAAYNAQQMWLKPTYPDTDVTAQLSGYAGLTPHPYQNQAVRRALALRGSMVCLDVGLGKTLVGLLTAALERGRSGRNSVVAVPKSVLANWRSEYRTAFPDGRLLVVGMEPKQSGGATLLDETGQEIWQEVTSAQALEQSLSRAASGEYDMIVMTHETLMRIPVAREAQIEQIEQEFYAQRCEYRRATGMSETLYARYARMKAEAWLADGSVTLDDLAGAAERARQIAEDLKSANSYRMAAHEKAAKKEERARATFMAKAFSSLGKDHMRELSTQWSELDVGVLIVDEAHRFKNIWVHNRGREPVKYLGASGESSLRALDLYFKARATRQTGGYVTLLTATPLVNSIVEIYNLCMLASPDLFPSAGIHNLDMFVERYCVIEPRFVPADDDEVEDGLREVMCLVALKNLDELLDRVMRVTDRRTAADVGLTLPATEREYVLHSADEDQERWITAILDDPVSSIRDLMGNSAIPNPIPPEDYEVLLNRYRLVIAHLLRRAELDLEMLDPVGHKGYVSPKVRGTLNDIRAAVATGEKCLVFCDAVEMPNPHTPARPNPNGYSFHQKLARLVMRETGLDANQVLIINGSATPDTDERFAIAERFRLGRARVLIVNRTAQEGVNLQTGTGYVFHLDLPWNPAALQQREGRVVRMGNTHRVVTQRFHLSNRALDPEMADILAGKTVWYEQFWSGQSGSIDAEATRLPPPSLEKIRALRIADQHAREAALAALREEDSRKALAAQTRESYKDFDKLQRCALALERHTAHFGQELSEKQLRTRADLHRQVETATERLRNDPLWPHPEILHEAAAVLIWHGRVYRVGMHLLVNGTEPHEASRSHRFIIRSMDPRSRRITLSKVSLTGAVDKHLRHFGLGSIIIEPYDQTRHAHDVAVRAYQMGELKNATSEIRADQRTPEILAGYRSGIRQAAGDKALLLRRNGALVFAPYQDGDEIVTPFCLSTDELAAYFASPESIAVAQAIVPEASRYTPHHWRWTTGTPHAWAATLGYNVGKFIPETLAPPDVA
ncbi:helicase-related protein [Deinococcus soli (ex Cha et al. 2016)]|uniref:SNF2 family DNA or RNA helicase n=2 Tax=Deinococcus soli (ex Cha et al. 2016) TaxID=1309411 RepID=A0ACC6KGD0_9DEIO|nr:helicase-related protein [Deinococcus soli (ex Cha et al. 2016)]MDR6218450.1 SNF2 family DNA or RNA helicase [Deinococcus soli (ex Cha et al. 2016)]MDR6329190.1 SNF2 family DNA or RNA helicase [Deinococcus soli (ex Cha et al. 2016)]MDR6751463.1 SNF2 family DNA or RNA helicase [Deinococcus soli (ex Cha et al. 2016)]